MKLRTLVLIVVATHTMAALGAPTVKRVNPKTIPPHIRIEVTAIGCDTKKLSPRYVAIWYATAKARVADVEGKSVSVALQLRDPRTNAFLINPGTRSVVEGGYLLASISFNSTILDQIVFQWRENDTIYEIYLSDFYSGERC
jgi:hypothetical protein